MGIAERASIPRMREEGRMCLDCPRPLDMGVGAMAWKGGSRFCDRCGRPQRVTLRYRMERDVWCVEFLDSRSHLPVAPLWRVLDAEKIRELIRRTPTRFTLADRQALDLGLSNGRGAIGIEVTADQLRKLKEKKA